MEPDSATYMEVAVDLQDLKLDHLYGRTPGYPLFLLLAVSSEVPQRQLFYLQMVLYGLIVFFTMVFLNRMGLHKKILVPLAILCILPYNIVHTGFVLTESLTIFFLIGGFLLLLSWFQGGHWSLLVLSGIALALSAVVKPTYQLISVGFAMILLIFIWIFPQQKQRYIKASAVLLASAVIIIGGLMLHNHIRLGYSGLTPDFGIYLSTKTPRVLERLPDEYAEVREILIKHRDERLLSVEYSHTGYMYMWGALPEVQEVTHLNYQQLSKYLLDMNLLLIKKAPLTYLQEVTYSISNLWLPSTTTLSDFGSRQIQFTWTALHYITAVVFILVCIFVFGLLMVFGSLPSEIRKGVLSQMTIDNQNRVLFITLGMAMIFYTIAISAMSDMGVARHRVPVDIVIFALIWVCIDLWSRIKKEMSQKGNSLCSTFSIDR